MEIEVWRRSCHSSYGRPMHSTAFFRVLDVNEEWWSVWEK
jgi:hypothetical protein